MLVVIAVPPAKDTVPRVAFTTPVVVAPAASAPVVLVAPAASGGEVVAGGAVVVVAARLVVAPALVVLVALAGTVVVAPTDGLAPAVVEVVASLADVVGTGTMGVGPSPVHTEVEVVEDGVASRLVVDVLVRVCVTGTVVAGGLAMAGGAVVGGAVVGGSVVVVVVVDVVVEVMRDDLDLRDEAPAGEARREVGSVVELPGPDVEGAGEAVPRAGVPPAPDLVGDDVDGAVVVVRPGVDVVVETVPELSGPAVVAVAA